MSADDETIRKVFVEEVCVHKTIKSREPRRFVDALVKALKAEKFSQAELERAAQNIVITILSPAFPSVARCLIECRLAREQLSSAKVLEAAE